MEDTDNRIISRLVDAARNRIWFDRLFRWPALALWISASLLIVAGLVHRFFHEMPATIVWISALAPVTLAGLAALLMARPRIREAAVAADRWSGAQSLLLAAWEWAVLSGISSAVGRLVSKSPSDGMKSLLLNW